MIIIIMIIMTTSRGDRYCTLSRNGRNTIQVVNCIKLVMTISVMGQTIILSEVKKVRENAT
jgi:hypothetical protein